MDEPHPVLMLLVPADWDAIPEALTELRRCLGEDHGGSLMLRQATGPLRSPLPLYLAYWPRDLQQFAQRDLRPRMDAAFYSIDWMELEDVG